MCLHHQGVHSTPGVSVLKTLNHKIQVKKSYIIYNISYKKIILFSEAGILHDDSELVVEAEVDAIVKLGMFIGDKIYSTDFASQCPCHPDRRM